MNVTVADNDGGSLVAMDAINISLNFKPSSEMGNPVNYTTDQSLTQLLIASRIYCAENYSGPKCEESVDQPATNTSFVIISECITTSPAVTQTSCPDEASKYKIDIIVPDVG